MKLKKHMLSVLILSLLCASSGEAYGADCVQATCIAVTTDPTAGGVRITATHNTPGSSTPPRKLVSKPKVPRRVVTRTAPRKPTTWIPWKPAAPRRIKPSTSTAKPKPRSSVQIPAKVVAAVSLSDSITQLLPGRTITMSPAPVAIVNLPVRFNSNTSLLFHTTATILDVLVGVQLHPSFYWNFGDGGGSTEQNPVHVFRTAGTYSVQLTVSWAGTWSAGAFTYPVIGNVITQSYQASLVVAEGPTRFNA